MGLTYKGLEPKFWQKQLDYNRNVLRNTTRRGLDVSGMSVAENIITGVGTYIELIAEAKLDELERSLGLR